MPVLAQTHSQQHPQDECQKKGQSPVQGDAFKGNLKLILVFVGGISERCDRESCICCHGDGKGALEWGQIWREFLQILVL